jgi:hypothetical protein
LVFQVQELLGPDGAARDQQGLVTSGDGQGVDYAGVNAGHFLGAGFSLGHRHPGGDVDEQLASVIDEPDRPDPFGVIGVVA